MLPKEAIIEFKKIYLKVYGVQIDDVEAERRANNLVGFYAAVYDRNERSAIGKNSNHGDSATVERRSKKNKFGKINEKNIKR